jgi:hypothetical protein
MKQIVFLLVFVSAAFAATAQKQGISGKVFWVSGNQMPSPGNYITPQQGAPREIQIYKVAKLNETDQINGFFTAIKTEFIKKVFSDIEGSFKIKLPPGEYSVFVKEPQGLFANSFDKDNKINVVVVKPGKFSWVTINIDYDAAY